MAVQCTESVQNVKFSICSWKINPRNVLKSKVTKRIIQSAELACYGSFKLCHTLCKTGTLQKPREYTGDEINYYIDIIAKNSNCTALLQKLDNKNHSYHQLCKRMADCLDDVIDAYVPPVPIIPKTRRRYSFSSLRLPENNFNIVTGDDDFDADNNTAFLSLMTAAEILEGPAKRPVRPRQRLRPRQPIIPRWRQNNNRKRAVVAILLLL